MKPHLWESEEDNPERVDIEWIGDNARFLLWFDEEGDIGWAYVSKFKKGQMQDEDEMHAESGYVPREIVAALHKRLHGNISQPSLDKDSKGS